MHAKMFNATFNWRNQLLTARVSVVVEPSNEFEGLASVSCRARWGGSYGFAHRVVKFTDNFNEELESVLDSGLLNDTLTELERQVAEDVEAYTKLVKSVAI